MRKTIEVRGARQNNLKDITVAIPRDTLTVITGVSGSGKSSLAYDVIYAEGQRRLLDSLSAFSRRWISQPKRAEVDFVFGLSPVVAIMQRKGVSNPRSTIGTITDIYDYLRLLFCVAGSACCPYCGREFPIRTVDQIIDRVQALPEATSVEVRAPVVKIYGEGYDFLFSELRSRGHRSLVIDGIRFDSSDHIVLDETGSHEIEVVLDRVVVKGDVRKILGKTIENGMRVGEGFLRFEIDRSEVGEKKYSDFYTGLCCPEHHVAMRELEPYYFSFNDPDSACRTCSGIGAHLETDPHLLVEKPGKSIRQGALTNTFMSVKHPYRYMLLYSLARHYGFSLDAPFEKLSERAKDVIFYGTGGEQIELVEPPDATRRASQVGQRITYEGLVNHINRWYRRQRERGESFSSDSFVVTNRLMVERLCPDCKGTRLKPQRLSVKVGGRDIHALGSMPISDLEAFLETLTVPAEKKAVCETVIRELITRLSLLMEVGVGYLSLHRNVSTISSGESQRVRLSSQIGSGLMGMLYILDEPSIGLHPRDDSRIIHTMQKLRDIGNTVIVVEHDVETMLAADHIIEMGPGPGIHGGKVIAQGTVEQVKKSPDSLTGQFLSGRRKIEVPRERRTPNGKYLKVVGARQNNLKNITVQIPLGVFISVTGVSGSGKSSLTHDVLFNTLHSRLHDRRILPGEADSVEGTSNVDSVINIDQSPIGHYWTSNPSTYVGISDYIRDIFSDLPLSRERGYNKASFSYNSQEGNGRCEECQGRGVIITPLQFMPDVETLCPLCKGHRFNKEVLEIKYRGKNIYDIFCMSFEEAGEFFKHHPAISRKVKVLNELGLGYLKMGQTADTLSGGESQRIKLAKELAKVKHGHRLYILDEPTTGLHQADIQRLLDCLNRLVDLGHTVLVIEHNLDVIKTADHIIDLGPEGGRQGGHVIAQGTPEEVSHVPESYTGQFLARVLAQV